MMVMVQAPDAGRARVQPERSGASLECVRQGHGADRTSFQVPLSDGGLRNTPPKGLCTTSGNPCSALLAIVWKYVVLILYFPSSIQTVHVQTGGKEK